MPITHAPYMLPRLCVIRILAEEASHQKEQATGFFYYADSKPYFVTCRHVLEDSGWNPTTLKVYAPIKSGLQLREKTIPLYSGGSKNWFTYTEDPRVDLAVIPMDEDDWKEYDIHALSQKNKVLLEDIGLGTDVMVIGYPEGEYDSKNNTPLARTASIASEYDLDYEGLPCFVIDGRMHAGMSGSPVVVKLLLMGSSMKSLGGVEVGRHLVLLGVHQGPIERKSTSPKSYPRHDDDWAVIYKPLDLHIVWRADLIEKMISKSTLGSIDSP